MSNNMQSVEEDKWITIKILRSQHKEVSKVVEGSAHFHNESDFYRSAIREKLVRFYK